MDILYFNTKNKEGLLTELKVPLDAPTFYDSGQNWVLQWVGKLPKSYVDKVNEEGDIVQEVTEWHEGEFFNIYLSGQENMDYFTKYVKSAKQILPNPKNPSITLL